MKCPTCGSEHTGRLPKQIELLPCPCCGGAAEFDTYDAKDNQVLVRCKECDLNTVPHTHEEAAAQWNKRPTPRMSESEYDLRQELFKIAVKLRDFEHDDEDVCRIGDRLVRLSLVCEQCHGTGQDGEPADANGVGGGVWACDKCNGGFIANGGVDRTASGGMQT